eukprot:Awhi_evm1s13423
MFETKTNLINFFANAVKIIEGCLSGKKNVNFQNQPCQTETSTPSTIYKKEEEIKIKNIVEAKNESSIKIGSATRYEDIITQYKVVDVIHSNKNGKVEVVYNRKKCYILKHLYATSEIQQQAIMNEIEISQCLSHKNIGKVIGCAAKEIGQPDDLEEKPKEWEKHFVLVLEYMQGGDLFSNIIPDEGLISDIPILPTILQLCESVQYLHSRNIAHRDIKPENITFTNDFKRVVLIDFGLSQRLRSDKRYVRRQGTCAYMAAELWENRNCDFKAVDVWAIGVVIYACFTGKFPWSQANLMKCMEYKLFVEGQLQQEPIWQSLPPFVQDLLSQLFHSNPKRRPTISQLISILKKEITREKIQDISLSFESFESSSSSIHYNCYSNNSDLGLNNQPNVVHQIAFV